MLQFSPNGKQNVDPADLIDPVESARAAGLRYVSDTSPGIRRRRAGKHFYYVAPDGSRIKEADTLERIRSLAVPPAWTDVWICPNQRGHLQATGFDSRRRKQYRYHPRWRELRDAVKYDRMSAFAEALPRIRERTERDLGLPGMPKEKVLAAVFQLQEDTLIRIGSEQYRRENHSFGLTTLRHQQVQVIGSRVIFRFRGKAGKKHSVEITNRRLARVVKKCLEIPGQELFQYIDDDGTRSTVESGDVNEYLKEITNGDFTAKDFRTWAGSVLAADLLSEMEPAESERNRKEQLAAAVDQVAIQLGNTPTVCRKCYVHPAVLEGFMDGTLLRIAREEVERAGGEGNGALSEEEQLVVKLLRVQAPAVVEARAA